ncbi:MAG: HAD family phosphatase [Oscillospiraceae bacterium]
MKLSGVILDLDGTLIDSMQIWHEIDVRFFTENGLDVPDGISEKVAKMSIQEWADFFVSEYMPTLTADYIIQRIGEMAQEYYHDIIPLKPYVKELLDFLEGNKIPFGIVTATYRKSAEDALQRLGILERMQFLFAGDEYPDGKTTSFLYELASEKMHSPKQSTLIIEDALHCVKIAKQAGFLTAGVYDPCTAPTDWIEICQIADISGNHLGEIIEKIDKHFMEAPNESYKGV